MQWQLHESQHLWCSKINCGSATCLFVQTQTTSTTTTINIIQNTHSATVFQSMHPQIYIFSLVASELFFFQRWIDVAIVAGCFQFADYICARPSEECGKKGERAHLDICSLNRLQPNAVFNDLLSMRIFKLSAWECLCVWMRWEENVSIAILCAQKNSIIHRSLKREANGNECCCMLLNCTLHNMHMHKLTQIDSTHGERKRETHTHTNIPNQNCVIYYSLHKYMRRLNSANNEMESSSVCCNRFAWCPSANTHTLSLTTSKPYVKCIRIQPIPFIEFQFRRDTAEPLMHRHRSIFSIWTRNFCVLRAFDSCRIHSSHTHTHTRRLCVSEWLWVSESNIETAAGDPLVVVVAFSILFD